MYFDQSAFGKRLSMLREKTGLTQEELSEKLHHGEKYIGRLERAERSPSLDAILELADFFHVSTDYLLTGQCPEGEPDIAKLKDMISKLNRIIQQM